MHAKRDFDRLRQISVYNAAMNKLAPQKQDWDQGLVIPSVWSDPQNLSEFVAGARANLLNIVPPEAFTQGHATFPVFMGQNHYVSDPEILREILKTRATDFPKSRSLNVIFNPITPNSILVTDGEKWRKQHKTVIPVFNLRNVEGFEPSIRKIADAFLAEHDFEPYSGRDVTPLMQDMTFEIISQILLGNNRSPLLQNLRDVFEEFLEDAVRIRSLDLAQMKSALVPNPRYFTHARLIRRFRGISGRLVTERLAQEPPSEADFLEFLIDAYGLRENPKRRRINEVRDNLVTFIIAGHETTAMTLSWALYSLQAFPKYQSKMGAEANAPLKEMTIAENYIKETMRLYPPVPLIARRTAKNENINGVKMRRNEGIVVPIIAIHRHHDHWPEPDRFIPDRFANFEPKAMTYMPFGAGARICIGSSFAMMEAKIVLAKIMEKYAILPNEHQPQPHSSLTMRSENGIEVNFERRASNSAA